MRAMQLDDEVTWDREIVWLDNDLANALSSYMTPEDGMSSNFEKPFWR